MYLSGIDAGQKENAVWEEGEEEILQEEGREEKIEEEITAISMRS
jgi:predicted nuclease with RNAse H fold